MVGGNINSWWCDTWGWDDTQICWQEFSENAHGFNLFGATSVSFNGYTYYKGTYHPEAIGTDGDFFGIYRVKN